MGKSTAWPTAEFFETYPLYKKLKGRSEDGKGLCQGFFEFIATPPIRLRCPKCQATQTFRMSNRYLDDGSNNLPFRSSQSSPYRNDVAWNTVVRAIYKCAACDAPWTFLLEFGPMQTFDPGGGSATFYFCEYVRKVGQHPRWMARIDSDLRKALGTFEDTYTRGLSLEGEGFGLGACAYYRSLVENLANALLDEHAKSLPCEDAGKFHSQRDDAIASGRMSETFDLVKPLLPLILVEGGANPLALAYGELSEALHGAAEPDVVAPVAREVIERVLRVLKEAKEADLTRTLIRAQQERAARRRGPASQR